MHVDFLTHYSINQPKKITHFTFCCWPGSLCCVQCVYTGLSTERRRGALLQHVGSVF